MASRESHPATSNKEYDDEELEFLRALDEAAARQGRRITSHVEAFRIARTVLGYTRPPKPVDFSHRVNVVFPRQQCRIIDPQVLETPDGPCDD